MTSEIRAAVERLRALCIAAGHSVAWYDDPAGLKAREAARKTRREAARALRRERETRKWAAPGSLTGDRWAGLLRPHVHTDDLPF
jgi:hypothetical protein